MDDVDGPFVIGRSLAVPGEVSEIAARRKDRGHSRNLGDLVGVRKTLERFDHQNQHHVVVDGVSISARHAAPHRGVERLAPAVAAAAERGEVGPVGRLACFLNGVYRRHDDDQRARIERVLDLAFVGVGHAHTRNRLGIRTGPPHTRNGLPVVLIVLHLGPDEVVAGIGHGAVRRGIGGAEQRSSRHLAAARHLQLHRIPDLSAGRRIERITVLPRRRIEGSLIDRASGSRRPRVAVFSGGRRERERRGARGRVVRIRIG